MKKVTILFFFILTLASLPGFGQTQQAIFPRIYELIEKKNFFKAKEVYDLEKNNLSTTHQKVIEAFLNNGFNRLEESNRNIAQLISKKEDLSDSLLLKLYEIKEDNSVKLFQYREAKNTLDTLFSNYKYLLSEDELKDKENNLKIWTALQDVPKQKVLIKETNRLKMTNDKAGLKNLKVHAEKDTVNFIFDTGANLSTVTETTAKKLNMEMLPGNIDVETITGETVLAKLALCPIMYLGNIEIQNAVFLVMKDEALSFPQLDFHIYGILGFPVIEALHEIQVTKDDYFVVPKEESEMTHPSNMAMNGLTPLIYIDGRHFTFDTGAGTTILYNSYFLENQKGIEAKYQKTKVSFAGAAGHKDFDGYNIDLKLHVLDKTIALENIQLIKDKIKEDEVVYGNIGQDVIQQFNKMTLNFDRMFIKFD